jgi:hypothetical protein
MPQPDQIVVHLAHTDAPHIADSLRGAFSQVLSALPAASPEQIALHAAQTIGGSRVVAEAERGAWSRYRVMLRAGGEWITIATVEITRRES